MSLQNIKGDNLENNRDDFYLSILEATACPDKAETNDTISISDASHMKIFLRKLLCLINWNPFMPLLGEVPEDPLTNGLRQDISAAMLWNEDGNERTVDQRNKDV